MLPDIQSEKDDRGIPVMVGVHGLSKRVALAEKSGGIQSVVAKVSVAVGLCAGDRGTHISRMVRIVSGYDMTVPGSLINLTSLLSGRMNTCDIRLSVSFLYGISVVSPVSRIESDVFYECALICNDKSCSCDRHLCVSVPVMTVCPCSLAMSDGKSSHSQRCLVDIYVDHDDKWPWIEDVVDAVSGTGSSLFPILKREDEKYIVKRAFSQPCFVEDVVRDTVLSVSKLDHVRAVSVVARSQESIHPFDVIASACVS